MMLEEKFREKNMSTPRMYDSLSEQLCPVLKEDVLTIYVCGVTVYDRCHVGHGRTKVVFDVWRRWLMSLGQPVRMVTNVTDIDDKIIARAQVLGVTWDDLANMCLSTMQEDDSRLGLLPPDDMPRATDYMPDMIELIHTLVARGMAYVSEDGGVYFDVMRHETYGVLSKQERAGLLAEHELGSKRHIADFALWKPAKEGEPAWESPWGKGRPGWHLECSAMVHACLGHPIDWHGGGMDLKFPHHENECAQSEAAWGAPMARHWMHVGLMDRDGQKMSKSLGNAVSLKEALDTYGAPVLRLFYLKTHYRKPLSWQTSALTEAVGRWERYARVCQQYVSPEIPWDHEAWASWLETLNHDFNTPQAIVLMDAWSKQAGSEDPLRAMQATQLLRNALNIFGIVVLEPQDDAWIDEQIKERDLARSEKDFARADAIRRDLLAQGIVLEDGREGVRWYRQAL